MDLDLSFDILKDEKRRLLYFDEKTNQALQINQKDVKFIKLYFFRFIFSFFVFYLAYLFLFQNDVVTKIIFALSVGIIVHFIFVCAFRFYFLKNKQPIKISQKTFDLRYQKPVLKAKRGNIFLTFIFSLMYTMMVLLELSVVKGPTWLSIVVGIVGFVVCLSSLIKIISINATLKHRAL